MAVKSPTTTVEDVREVAKARQQRRRDQARAQGGGSLTILMGPEATAALASLMSAGISKRKAVEAALIAAAASRRTDPEP